MLQKVLVLCLLLGAFYESCWGERSSDSLICKRVENDAANVLITGPQGPPGLPGLDGMPGLPGLRGERGRPGEGVDYSRLEILVEQQVAEAIQMMKKVTPQPNFRCEDLKSNVQLDGKCYFAVLPEHEVKFLAAEQLCLDRGAKPANIYNRVQFDKIMSYLRELRQSFFHVYLGMEFDPETDGLSFYDGSPAQYTNWRTGDPVRYVADPVKMTRVAINIYADYSTDGMLTTAMIWPKTGVLCEAEGEVEEIEP